MRLFVAAWPSAEVIDLLGGIARPPQEGVRWTPQDQWHVTLRFLGEVDDPEPVATALTSLPAPKVVAALGPAPEVLSRRVLVLPVTGLDAVASAVRDRTGHLGKPPERRRFRGHITLARLRGAVPPLPAVPAFPDWSIGAITLVRSSLHPSGAVYERLAEFPLGSA